jgi:serine/threonine protein kinase
MPASGDSYPVNRPSPLAAVPIAPLHPSEHPVDLRRGALPWRGTVEIAATIADGLAAAHSEGVIHRDLKPEDIVLTAGRPPVLAR